MVWLQVSETQIRWLQPLGKPLTPSARLGGHEGWLIQAYCPWLTVLVPHVQCWLFLKAVAVGNHQRSSFAVPRQQEQQMSIFSHGLP